MDVNNKISNHNTINKRKQALEYVYDKKSCLENQISELNNEIDALNLQVVELERILNSEREKRDVNYFLFSPYKSIDVYNSEDKIRSSIEELSDNIESKKVQVEKYRSEQDNILCVLEMLQEKEDDLQNGSVLSEKERKAKEYNSYTKRIDKIGRMIIEAQEIERKRIARELHDTTVQNLTGLMHKVELCTKLIDMDTIRTKLELIMIMNTLHNSINDMRTIIYDLRPMSLTDLGLVATIESFLGDIKNKSGLQTSLIVNNQEQIVSPVINLSIFRVIQEACNNVIKHANATSIVVKLEYMDDRLQLIITDDGQGFDPDLVLSEKTVDIRNFGLSIMIERINLLSGKIKIESKIKQGTKIFIEVPYNKDEREGTQ